MIDRSIRLAVVLGVWLLVPTHFAAAVPPGVDTSEFVADFSPIESSPAAAGGL